MSKRIIRLLALGDIHGMYNELLHVLNDGFNHKPDAIISVGDIGSDILGNLVTFNERREALYRISTNYLLLTMAQCKKPVIYVAGNHDHRNFLFTKGINNFLLNVDILAGGVVTKVQNVCILGIGGSPKTEAFWINEWNKDNVFIDPESLRKWNNAKYRILISHCPPINTWLDVDITYARFLGSQWIRQFLTQCKRKPNLFLCGHIHESYNVDFVSETPSINLGSLYLYSRNLFDSQSGRYNTHSTQSLQYWIIDLFPNKVEARNYQSIDFFLDEFILSNAFIIQDGKVLMKKGKAAWHLSVSDDNAPILKESKIIMRRQTTSITPTPGISKMSVKIKDRIKNNEE